jgi:hypothetical protein
MRLEYTLLLLGGLGVAALAVGNYLIPKKDGQSFATQAGEAVGGSISQFAGSTIGSVPVGAITGAWQAGYQGGVDIGLQQAGYNLGTWVRSNPWIGEGSWLYNATGGWL